MPLVVVPTPLGNLRDVTLRAVDELRACDLVVAEDSRVARRLLSALEIRGKEIWTYHEHNAPATTAAILERAAARRVVLTTDAGMPGISDPGTDLIAAARTHGIAVEVLPGPSASVAAAVLSGFPLHRVLFEGFVPRARAARRERFESAMRSGATSLWFESPARIRGTLDDLAALAPDSRVFVVREYTKVYEQQILGSPAEVRAALPDPVRGEIVFAIAARSAPKARSERHDLDQRIDALLASGASISSIAKALAAQGLGERRHLYARASERKRAGGALKDGS